MRLPILSDFLGRIFFTRPNELDFCMWPSIPWKNIVPYLVHWFLFRFPQVAYTKTQFFPGGVLSKQGFCFFQTIESAKRAFSAMVGSGKPAFLHALFLENEKQNSRKNYTAMFSR